MTLPAVKEIIAQAQKREKESQSRFTRYERYAQAYFGESEGAGRAMNADGRPALRVMQMRDSLATRPGPNMILPMVDDYVALRGRLPTMTVVPWDSDKQTEDDCKRLSRALRSQWLHSNMVHQNVEGAWYLTTKGEALYLLTSVEDDNDPDTERGIYITVVDPSACLPRFGTGWRRQMLEDVIVHERVDAFTAREQWSVRGIAGKDDLVDVYHYIGKTSNGIVVGDQLVASIDHNMGFCPAEWVRTKPLPRDAQSDIAQVVDLHTEYRIMFATMSDSLIESTYSQVWIKDPASMQDRFEIGPGADPIVVKGGTGAVGRLAPNPPPDAAVMIMGEAWQQITRMTGSAPVRTEQQIGGSNISGRAITAVQGPMEQRMQLGYEVLGAYYQRLNGKIMRLLYKRPAFQKEMTVFGTERSGLAYTETFSGEEFRGYTRNVVKFGSQLGGSTHEKAVVVNLLLQQGLVTGVWALEQLEVDDPERLYAEAQAEHKQKAQDQMAMQGPPPGAGPPGGGAPPGGPPGAGGGPPPPGADQGAPPPDAGQGGPVQPPPQMPGFAPVDTAPTTPGKGFPGPLPNVGGMIQKAMETLLNDSRMAGMVTDVQPIPGGVQVTASSFHDKSRIRKAFHDEGFGLVDVVVQKQGAAASNGTGGQ